MRTLYDPAAYRFSEPPPSWWEASAGPAVETTDLAGEDGPVVCDVAVIGGGYTGLSAAYHLARDHGVSVRVLEAGQPGWGASGRNGGFCGPSASKLSTEAMVRTFGFDATAAFNRMQREATELVADLLDREGIDADKTGARGELCFAHTPDRARDLKADAENPHPAEAFETRYLDRDACAEFGMAGPEVHGGLLYSGPFGLHPLKYCRGLARAAQKHGAIIHGDARVTGWHRDGGDHMLETAKGVVRAKKVIVGTNGYTSEDLTPGLRGALLPTLTNILVTRPLTDNEQGAQGWTSTEVAYDTRTLLHYVRLLPDGRFLFGGRGGWDASESGVAARRAIMRQEFDRMFPAWSHVETPYFWNGFVCVAADRVMHIGAIDNDPTMLCAMAYHGSGVASATWSGRMTARLAAGAAQVDVDVPAVVRGAPPKFPFPMFRKTYLKAAYALYGWSDRRGFVSGS